MGEDGIELLQQRLAERTREHKATREAALESKFRKLPSSMSSKNDKLVHNLSSKELTEEQMQVLRHEASFNTADAKPANMIAAVESILSQTRATDETKNLIRHQVSSLLMAHRPRDVLSKVERDALKELRADNYLDIVPADKRRSTVLLDRTDYIQKAKSLLEDRQSYVPCESNPIKTLTREINATLLAMENSVHKEGVPLRPIVSLKGTPTYGLAKWLFQRLKFLTSDSNTTVSSSRQFLEKLKGDLAVETIELLLREKYNETENRLGHAQIIQLLKFCLKTYFTFDGTVYEQVKGTPMGSPISGLIAEAVLQRLESLVFRHHRPKFWARYVDDTFVVIERDQVLTFKEHLNAVFPDIQFTMEEKENNQLAFLDVLVCRKDCGGLKTKVLRKATYTTQILNFNSNHPISNKRSCVRALYRRVETHCSEMEDKVSELQYLRRVMRANGYPRNFVNQCIRKGHQRPNPTGPKFWRALPGVTSLGYPEKMEPFSMQQSPSLSTRSCGGETDQIRPMEPKAKSHTLFWAVFFLSQISGLLAVILVFVWIRSYDDGFPNQLVFDYHPPFMVLSMIFCLGEALLVYRVFPGCRKIVLKILHASLLVASLVIGAVGLRAAYNPDKGRPYSLHSWIGIIAFTLYGLQWLIGFIVFLIPRISSKVRAKLLPSHTSVGLIIFVFTIVAVLTGITEKNFFPGDYSALPPAARVGNAIGLLVITFGSLVIYLLYRNDYARTTKHSLSM
ncbi:hypothetical protein SprV_0200808100 [Sparganum proliferum]